MSQNPKSIIFIHGNSLSAKSFSKQVNHFNNYQVYCFELPGHGDNKSDSYTEDDCCIPGFINHLKKFIEQNKIAEYIIVGHSLGGHVAIEALDELTGLKGIVIFGTPPISKPANFAEAFLPSDVMHLAFQADLSEDELKSLSAVFTSSKADVEEVMVQIKNTESKFRPLFAKSIGELKHKNEKELVETSQLPIAVFHGEHEPLVSLTYLESIVWKNRWKNKIHIINNAAHSPYLECPTEFNTLLSQFCETVFG